MKSCEDCKHIGKDFDEEPCCDCSLSEDHLYWTPIDDIDDNVNHPKHYEGSTSLECFDVMEMAFGKVAVYDFCICNAFKYLWRYKNKNGVEDLNKAEWYLDKAERFVELFADDDNRLSRLKELLYKHKLVQDVQGVQD